MKIVNSNNKTHSAHQKNEALHDRLYRAIMENRITQKELARRAEIDAAALSRFMSGKKVPTLKVLERLATILGCTEEWLLYGVGGDNVPQKEESKNSALEQLIQDITETYMSLDTKAEEYELLAKLYQHLTLPKKKK